MLRFVAFVLAIACVSATKFFIMAPNMLHVGVDEVVSMKVYGMNQDVNVQMYLQDFPARRKTFSQVQGIFKPDIFGSLTVKVDAANLPDVKSLDKQYVYLVVKSDDPHFKFQKETKILLSYRDGMILIQTDKPIYTPKQQVRIRVFPLGFDLKPTSNKVTLIVENPQGIRVRQMDNLDSDKGIISKTLQLSDFVLYGNWTITALYGHRNVYNTSAKFEVKEYVLPKFSVKLRVPPYILKTDTTIAVVVTSRYTYNKPVVGSVRVDLKIAGRNMDPILFSRTEMLLDDDGEATVRERVDAIKMLAGNIWFPEGGRLEVEAKVIEKATGVKETAIDTSAVFTSTPYNIKYTKTPEYFKPGLPFVVKVEVKHPNKKPVIGIDLAIMATGKQGNGQSIALRRRDDAANLGGIDRTNDLGLATFTVDVSRDVVELTIKVETKNDDLLPEQNGEKQYIAQAYHSPSGSFLMLRQLNPGKVGRQFTCEAFLNTNKATKLSYFVVAKGRIIAQKSVQNNPGILTTIPITATADMSPSARLIGYYILDSGEVVSDNILLDIEDQFPTPVKFSEENGHGSVNVRPSNNHVVTVEAPKGTRVALLGVDQSVYLLNNNNRMTAERVYKEIETLDLGCGVGGGRDNKDVFLNAGVMAMTESFNSDSRQSYKCPSDKPGSRKKRSLTTERRTQCCDNGKKPSIKSCALRVSNLYINTEKDCKQEFLKCCNATFGSKDMSIMVRSGLGEDDFGFSIEEIIEQLQVRSFFPETWIYDEIVADDNGIARLPVTIPDTITTWVLQAVAVNDQQGFGMAKPLNLLASLDFFVSLKLPYSAQRGEQISVMATVFNYMDRRLTVSMFLEGSKDFCSLAHANQRAPIATIAGMQPNEVRSISFPIVPTVLGRISIEVTAVDVRMNGGDRIKKSLLVLPEGVVRRKTQSFVLDPRGSLVDVQQKGDVKPTNPPPTQFQSSRIFGNNKQTDTIKLVLPADAIPGSVKAKAYISGNLMGPVVSNLINGGLNSLLRMPSGCGEQTMLSLGPNVYVFQYLQNTKQVTDKIERDAFHFIQSGYERELNYRRTDLSFSAWGNDYPGSTWLTAFVMKVFSQAGRLGGVNIDPEVVCQSVGWIVNNQRHDGAFPEVHEVIHKEMNGGTYSEGEVAMTSFVLSSLLECSCPSVNVQGAINKAVKYLEDRLEGLNKPYTMALTAYALSISQSTKKMRANERLTAHAIYDPASNTRHWNAGGIALNVETAGYALLTQLALGRVGYAGPVVVWLTQQRNTRGGFISTQDTCVALQALAKYSERSAGGIMDLRIEMTAELKSKWNKIIHIVHNNSLLQRQIDVTPILGGELYFDTTGSGVAQVQVELRYNIPSARDESCEFEVNVTTTRPDGPKKAQGRRVERSVGAKKRKGKGYCYKRYKARNGCQRKSVMPNVKRYRECCKGNTGGGWAVSKLPDGRKQCTPCKRRPKTTVKPTKKPATKKPPAEEQINSLHVQVCTRYKKAGLTAGMSMVDVGIFTGFSVDMPSIDQLAGVVDMYEISDRSIVFYLSKIPSDRAVCLKFKVNRESEVGMVQPVPVNVYDYYEPGDSCTTFYGPDKKSPLSMGVCSPKQCQCTQDKCTPKDPPIRDVGKLQDKACRGYDFAVKGTVVIADEHNSWLQFAVKVTSVFKQGNVHVKVDDLIEFKKRGTCLSPDLKKGKDYVFMGRDKNKQRVLDNSAWVKEWPKEGRTSQRLQDIFNFLQC